ncbi:MAG: TM0106 family RecB-like putative nuclease [Candidatus Ozemobacteraceae bacterium]
MNQAITTKLIEAYSLCAKKAFLLLNGQQVKSQHPYEVILQAQEASSRQVYFARLRKEPRTPEQSREVDLAAGDEFLTNVLLSVDGLKAHCDALLRISERSKLGNYAYQPVKVVSTRTISRSDVVGLAFMGHVLGKIQARPPGAGIIVFQGERSSKVKILTKYKRIRGIIDTLTAWMQEPVKDVPPALLNKHCPSCSFCNACRQQAIAEDNLSLMGRMTPPLLRKYNGKGIFTVKQLSFLFRPRRSRKGRKRPVRHSLELQALALRTGNIYIEQLPEVPRGSVELFVDLEGVPDRKFYYLVGLLICRENRTQYLPFWANTIEDEKQMWSSFVSQLAALPEVAIFHYGAFERKAFTALAQRHGSGFDLAKRLVNISGAVFGKVYFPVYSNTLKDLGRHVGATWADPESSGLQSLVWRYQWENTMNSCHKESLLRYNREDCEALRLLVNRLTQISVDSASDNSIEFANRPKRHASDAGNAVHRQLDRILKSAEEDSRQRGIQVRSNSPDVIEIPRKRGGQKGHKAYLRTIPAKTSRIVRVYPRRKCSRCGDNLSVIGGIQAERTLTDLTFTRSGCRKRMTRYLGTKAHCTQCNLYYNPPALIRLGREVFGHAFKAWSVFQRVVLRLPYRIICQVTEHLFGIGLSPATLVNFLRHMAKFYAPTEKANIRRLLGSPFVHADETKVNIEGQDHYVWVFTDGQHVIFRLTETREPDIVHHVLSGYEGVLVSDFYGGYDALPCRQQKCLVHLIGDINDDLWKTPFDRELEIFAIAFEELLVPILVQVEKYGLKTWHLKKFDKDVKKFYDCHVDGREYESSIVTTYQKRFDRYRNSLFTFLYVDGIPWNNNMGERALRQLAIQRKISGTFFKHSASHYLLLLAISQTCRFQEKSFLRFLLSKSTDVDSYLKTKRIKYSRTVKSENP